MKGCENSIENRGTLGKENFLRMILIDQDIQYGKLFKDTMERAGVELETFQSIVDFSEKMIENFDSGDLHAIILEYQLQGTDGIEMSQYIQNYLPETPVILISDSLLCDEISVWPGCIKAFLPKHMGSTELATRAIEIAKNIIKEKRDS